MPCDTIIPSKYGPCKSKKEFLTCIEATASIPPAAPIRWPVIDFVEFTLSCIPEKRDLDRLLYKITVKSLAPGGILEDSGRNNAQ